MDLDDWSGVTDPAERRKRQNRLRQRLVRKYSTTLEIATIKSLWRLPDCGRSQQTILRYLVCETDAIPGERKRTAAFAKLTSSVGSSWNGFGILISGPSHRSMARTKDVAISNYARRDLVDTNVTESLKTATKAWKVERCSVIPPLMSYTTAATFGQPTPPLIFPLSPDHCLLTMVQYNVQRASLFNMAILSLLEHLPLECGGTLNLPSLNIDPPSCVPPELLPTALQIATPHDYWIDIFPCPPMRDNLIRLYRQYDAHDLQRDLAKSLYEGFVDGEQRGCMVWGEPWTVNGWEVSGGFVRKWGFLLKGCSDLVASTNRWRESRGEDPLVIEI